jgi:hypothetical protein
VITQKEQLKSFYFEHISPCFGDQGKILIT